MHMTVGEFLLRAKAIRNSKNMRVALGTKNGDLFPILSMNIILVRGGSQFNIEVGRISDENNFMLDEFIQTIEWNGIPDESSFSVFFKGLEYKIKSVESDYINDIVKLRFFTREA